MLPEEIADARQRRYNGTISWLRKPHAELMVMRVRPDFPIPPHRPGQYCSLGLGNRSRGVPGCQERTSPADEARSSAAYSISHPILDDADEL